MVLETIRLGRLVWYNYSLAEAKSLKIGLKGLSGYHSNEMAGEAARQGASGLNKRATLTKISLSLSSNFLL
jgi:hypothetical protein